MSDKIPVRVASIAHEVQDSGDVVMFDEKGNRLLLLNDVGAAVWLLMDGQRGRRRSPRHHRDAACRLARVEADVRTFLQTLVSHGVIELR